MEAYAHNRALAHSNVHVHADSWALDARIELIFAQSTPLIVRTAPHAWKISLAL